jgi:hypothetical protein
MPANSAFVGAAAGTNDGGPPARLMAFGRPEAALLTQTSYSVENVD